MKIGSYHKLEVILNLLSISEGLGMLGKENSQTPWGL
jgi:hypothetical protein